MNNKQKEIQPPIEVVDYSVKLSPQEAKILRDLGLKQIQTDDDALIDYAINRMLWDITINLEKKVDMLTKIKNKRANKIDIQPKLV
jgi:hypothetical protein